METLDETYPCPCCGYLVFDEPAGSFAICPICFWEDDIVQLGFPLMAGGANSKSLVESQQTYMRYQVSDERFKANVRTPQATDRRDKEWRPLNPSRDPHLKDGDVRRWQSMPQNACLYWWREDYWLANE